MTNIGFHGNRFRGFKVAQSIFSTKPLTKDTAQVALLLVFNESANTKIALLLVFNESANTKIAFCTYLKLTQNEKNVGCP